MIRDVKDIEQSTLWEDTGRQIQEKRKGTQQDKIKNIVFVVGERHAGKTSFLKIVKNDFDPETKPNAFVEYQYVKVGREKKFYIHFYEIGSKSLLGLIQTFAQKKDIRIIVAVCVDLSKGRHMIIQTMHYLSKIKELFKNKPGVDLDVKNKHQDSDFIEPMPVKMALVGCKWDLFERADQQSKKWISRALRYLAHTHSASVLTCSNKNTTLGLNLRAAFVEFLLGQSESTSKNVKDHSKPIFAKFGDDNINDMNLPTSGSLTNIEVLQKQLESCCQSEPKSQQKNKNSDEVAEVQSKLEEAIRQKRKELLRYFKSSEPQSKGENSYV